MLALQNFSVKMDDSGDYSIKRKTLLAKYEIPIHYLDFEYVNNCTDAKTLEKVVMILRSGEEGYFPDLTRCAEEKLKELKPNSKLFRVEVPLISKDALDEEKRIQIDDEISVNIIFRIIFKIFLLNFFILVIHQQHEDSK